LQAKIQFSPVLLDILTGLCDYDDAWLRFDSKHSLFGKFSSRGFAIMRKPAAGAV
jgi:hypothetical protein